MSPYDWLQIALYLGVLVAFAPPLGAYLARVFEGSPTRLDRLFRPLERAIYRVAGVDEREEMTWSTYTWALLAFNAAGVALLFALQEAQGWLPLNPQGFGAVRPDQAFNAAVSFVTNTNWQSYSGETTMSHLTQMAGMTVQNFLSPATGIAAFAALARGLTRKTAQSVGNFWVDLTRTTLYILIPLSLVLALLLVSQGVVQTLSPYARALTVEGGTQTIAVGPAASQVAIKQLGTNGGGFFNANSAHPLENPTPFTNFLEMLALLLIPVALPYTFGRMAGDRRQGWAIFAAMTILLLAGVGVALGAEVGGNPSLAAAGVAGGANLEGKELRLGPVNSVLWAVATTATSTGAVNSMHDSLTPLAGMVPLLNMMLGEVIFGGVGAGMYSMLVFVIVGVFIAGLMVGRTPEYLGKKIQAHEMKMATLAILIPSACILIGSGVAAVSETGLASRANLGPHGLSEILYAFSSAAANNGSAFAGLNANTTFYNIALGIAMLLGRFGVIVPVLAIAGSMAEKKAAPPGPGTFPTGGPLFVGLLTAVVLIVGALTFFPALALGPVVEHLLMIAGRTF